MINAGRRVLVVDGGRRLVLLLLGDGRFLVGILCFLRLAADSFYFFRDGSRDLSDAVYKLGLNVDLL